MKKSEYVVYGIFMVLLLAGCGSDSEPDKAKKGPDKIEKIGNGASTLGYDGDAIKKQLREMEQTGGDHNNELDEVTGN